MASNQESGGLQHSTGLSADAFLSVHPSVVFKLGADLITDDVQAITELVKNSYDAGSKYCNVLVETRELVPLRPETATPDGAPVEEEHVQGFIRIQDGGSGMRRQDIVEGWLTVSASRKGALKARLKSSGSPDRTPLGDKGLGRLGAQRLGRSLVLRTVPELQPGEVRADAPAHQVTMVWHDFEQVDSLMRVPIRIEQIEARDEEHGSIIEIRGLRDLDTWRGQGDEDSDLALQREFGTMISPYDQAEGFVVNFQVDDTPIDLRERARAVLKGSTLSYALDYAEGRLAVGVGLSTSYLRPVTGAQAISDFDSLVTRDNGYAFLTWLIKSKPGGADDLNIEPGDDLRFVRASTTVSIEDLEPERLPVRPVSARGQSESAEPADGELDDTNPEDEAAEAESVGPIADPGPFRGQIDQVILRHDPTDPTKRLFASRDEYSEFVKSLRGVRVYRDGFGIRVGADWINLASQWSSGRSWYTLRPDNTLGHIDLSARHNDLLEETTNREAFRETPAYRNFMRLLAAWLSYGARVQEFVRRGYNEYKASMLMEEAELPPSMAPEAVVGRLQQQAARVETTADSLSGARVRVDGLTQARERIEVQARKVEDSLFTDDNDAAPFSRASAEIATAQSEASEALALAEAQVEEFRKQRALLDVVAEQVRAQEERLQEVWETVALGLVAETLSHEVLNLTQRLRGRSAQILTYLAAQEDADRRLWAFAEEVRSIGSSLSKQVSRLDPSLRYVRDRRDDVRVGAFAADLADYYQERWSDELIDIVVDVVQDFTLRINQGRLQQVLDNLMLNSHYWVGRGVRGGSQPRGRVVVTVNNPTVSITDNGPGIDPSLEHILFDPFVTSKPGRQGRGLGLYIVRQLLEADGATIALASDRNDEGRLTTFVVDFSRTDS